MNYQQARIFLTTTIIIGSILICGMILRPLFIKSSNSRQATDESLPVVKIDNVTTKPDIKTFHISQKVGNLAKQFNDLNEAHLAYAYKIGISPIASTRDILKIKQPIVHIKTGEYYKVDKLSHSYPYLVSEAAALLDTIGLRFNQKLSERNGGNYKIKVTSLLRTTESIARLQHGNVNSTSNSAHLYGTTFDISYVDFDEQMFNTGKLNDGQLKNLLAETLLELREEGKCLVKYERKQGCFHITATGK